MSTVDNIDNTIRLILEVTRESDDSFSISLEDEHFPEDSDERYPAGLSEGIDFDPAEITHVAGDIVSRYLREGPGFENGETGAIYRIAVPLEFKESDGQG